MEYTIKLDQFEDQGGGGSSNKCWGATMVWGPPKVPTPFEEVLITTWNDLSLLSRCDVSQEMGLHFNGSSSSLCKKMDTKKKWILDCYFVA